MPRRARVPVVVLGALALVAGWYRSRSVRAATAPLDERVDLQHLSPGHRALVPVGDLGLVVSVPEGEGHTGGTFRVAVPDLGFDSGALPRDGSLEAAWIADVNEDGDPDAVIVVRGGGSGSHASLVVLESAEGSFVVRSLPPVPPTSGYMGHDEVVVRGGQVVRPFPTYVDRSELRLDRQWTAERGARGEWPVRSEPDTNVRPSGRTLELGLDRATGGCRVLP